MSIISASATCSAPPSVACLKILSEEGIKAWWIGKLKIEQIDKTWPALGSKMIWKAGGSLFKAQVKTDSRPSFIELFVETPSANSIIKERFEPLPNGGTRYTKSVEPLFRSKLAKFFGPLFNLILKQFVNREVKKAVTFADRSIYGKKN